MSLGVVLDGLVDRRGVGVKGGGGYLKYAYAPTLSLSRSLVLGLFFVVN